MQLNRMSYVDDGEAYSYMVPLEVNHTNYGNGNQSVT